MTTTINPSPSPSPSPSLSPNPSPSHMPIYKGDDYYWRVAIAGIVLFIAALAIDCYVMHEIFDKNQNNFIICFFCTIGMLIGIILMTYGGSMISKEQNSQGS